MSFATYMVAFLVFMAVMVWLAVFLGVPQQYLAVGVGVLVLAAAAGIGSRIRARHARGRGPQS